MTHTVVLKGRPLYSRPMRYLAKVIETTERFTTNDGESFWMVAVGYLLPPPPLGQWGVDMGDSTLIVQLRSPFKTEERAAANGMDLDSNARVIAIWALDGFTGQFRPLTEEEMKEFQYIQTDRLDDPEEYWRHIDFDYEMLYQWRHNLDGWES